jgi:N-acetylneuraminic acid mutarotase
MERSIMKTKITFVLVGSVAAIVLSSAGSARADTWTQKADMPTARHTLSTSAVDGKIYAFGGVGGLQTVEEYDPATDAWAARTDMPTARALMATSVVDGKIYAIGGLSYWPGGTTLAAVEAYDPVTDTWTRKADLPAPRDGMATSVVNGKIYAIGGGVHGEFTVATVEEYDPATDTWTTKADMPTAREILSTSVVNGKIYAIGGQSRNALPAFSSVEEYDPVTDTWTKKADMPTPRDWMSTSVLDERIYAFGGTIRRGGAPISTLTQYDPATDTWTQKDNMPVLMAGMSTSIVDGRIYVVGGTSASYPYDPPLSTVWEYDIGVTVPSPDFNGDGIVDGADMSIMVDHWHTDNALYDIAPLPWGDGIVDVQDLIVLAEHLFEDYGDTVIDRRILAGSDDAEEALNAGFSNDNNSSDLEIVDDHKHNGGGQLIGLTFRDIYIAPGEVISNAYIEFVCDETKNGTDDAYFLIWGHFTPNPDGFIEPFVISDRPKTEAKVSWVPDPWNAVGQKIQTVNIAPIIQELIDQEGWAAGNAVEIIIGADPSIPAFTGVRCAESYDGDPSNAPLLHIEISVP